METIGFGQQLPQAAAFWEKRRPGGPVHSQAASLLNGFLFLVVGKRTRPSSNTGTEKLGIGMQPCGQLRQQVRAEQMKEFPRDEQAEVPNPEL